MIVAIGTDHAGFPLKEAVLEVIGATGHEALDCGAERVIPGDDYPDYAQRVAQAIAERRAERGRGIGGREQVPGHSSGALPRHILGSPRCRGRRHECRVLGCPGHRSGTRRRDHPGIPARAILGRGAPSSPRRQDSGIRTSALGFVNRPGSSVGRATDF
jgi:hypothetical protein